MYRIGLCARRRVSERNRRRRLLARRWPPFGVGRRTSLQARKSQRRLAAWNDPWLLVSCHRNNFCVVKGHFCSFLVSNILVTSAFCRLTFLSIQLFFHNSYSLAQFISLKRDALISWNYFDRLNVLRSFSKFYFQKSTLGTSAFAFWFFAFDLICFRFNICLNFKRMLMF